MVSVVIPTRNQASFLRRCIDGCLAQELPEAEVLVVDGVSTDGTQGILAGYGNWHQISHGPLESHVPPLLSPLQSVWPWSVLRSVCQWWARK